MEECPSSMWLGYWELVKQEAGASVDYTKFICRNGVNPVSQTNRNNPYTLILSRLAF